MRRLLTAFAICFGLVQTCFAQNEPCDELVNTGELDCLYEVIGQDSCSLDESTPCPSEGCDWFETIPGLAELVCLKGSDSYQQYGWVNLSPGSTAPKWSGPPAGVNGRPSMVTSAIACSDVLVCTCITDKDTGITTCEAISCGHDILLTLAKDMTGPACISTPGF